MNAVRIADILREKQTFSFEIFPPKDELPVEAGRQIVSELATYGPDYMSVTFSAGGSGNSEHSIDIAAHMQDEQQVTALAHLTCIGSTREQIAHNVKELTSRGVNNILALRGDRVPGQTEGDFRYASDLISYLKEQDVCVGAACYPEGHVECEDDARSMEHLKMKQDAGADFLVTQLFFDNELFYRFREACDRARIKIPVVAGIMPFTSESQVKRMAFTCGATIPARLIKRLVALGNSPEDLKKAGIEYACDQLTDLAANGVDGLHVYCMNRPEVGKAARDALLDCAYLEA
ncbi:MAG: methylenetetrahydrofolate reductase [Atopobiaceae bacterium]|nr:methylenetetrahydrofolate reductase [Atopobiaceae bacterium]